MTMDFKHKRIVIVGLGKSGIAAALFLHNLGADLTLTDAADAAALGPAVTLLKEKGIRLVLGGHPFDIFENADLIVLSPGVPHTLPPVAGAAEKGIPVWGEIELAARFIREPIIAVTGTNGKTTTTRLIGDMLSASGFSTFVGGNIGTPLIQYVADGVKAKRVVVEVSSFQLDTIHSFKPSVGVLLNISADHLDRYPSIQAYANAKIRLFENQGPQDTAILNNGDPLITAAASHIKSRVCYFNATAPGPDRAVISGDTLVLSAREGTESHAMDLTKTHLIGRHNHENIAAAALAALAAGAGTDSVRTALASFKGLPHRLEWVGRHNDVDYYDDSKATNVDAVVRAVDNFQCPLILIMGGRDKGGDYQPLAQVVKSHVKQIVVIGEASDIIENALGNDVPVHRAADMDAAVSAASGAAEAGSAVLLSPACASFDMFNSYAHRGDAFQKAVANLRNK